MDILKDLNEEQKRAVQATEGYVRIIAGAGSGKTKTLAHRFAYLVNEIGINPANIMCVTFTNKAAKEMKTRISKLIGEKGCPYVSTFHSFCVTLLREDGHCIQYPKDFVILDNDDQKSIISSVLSENDYTLKDMSHKDALHLIESYKGGNPEYPKLLIEQDLEYFTDAYQKADSIEKKVVTGYFYYQKKFIALDFNDLIKFAIIILENNSYILTKWQKRMQYIMVDEFQDIDSSQYKLVELLNDMYHNLFIVGDPDQTIYTWRGAKVSYINNFDLTHLGTETIILSKNYRSTPGILNVANNLIANNNMRIPKELVANKQGSTPVVYTHCKTSAEEAEYIVKQINELKGKGIPYSDIAVLYRAHSVSRAVEEAFITNNVPYRIYSGTQFYERKEIKDIIAYMRLILYKDDLSFKRVINEPRRGIGKKKIVFLEETAKQLDISLYEALKYSMAMSKKYSNKDTEQFVALVEKYSALYKEVTITDLAAHLMQDSGYIKMLQKTGDQERLDNLAELVNSINTFESTYGEEVELSEYLERISLYTSADNDKEYDRVKLMTIHTAKGLEFPFVFMCGMSENIIPTKRVKDRASLEEERRLAYVAFTRAEQGLVITDAEGLSYDGTFQYPSRFILEIDKKLLSYTVELNPFYLSEAKAAIAKSEALLDEEEEDIFETGTTVIHKNFGRGVILKVDEDEANYYIEFDKFPIPRFIGFHAPLQKI